jgi:hypothetical protein
MTAQVIHTAYTLESEIFRAQFRDFRSTHAIPVHVLTCTDKTIVSHMQTCIMFRITDSNLVLGVS